jgi:hypothetical protein
MNKGKLIHECVTTNKQKITMKFSVLALSIVLSLLLAPESIYAQQNRAVGGGLIYNLQTKSFGIDARAEYPVESISLLEGLTVSPQLSYYPWFNRIHEFYLGSSVHLGVYSVKNWKFYGLTTLSYNGWINYNNSNINNAKFSNLGFELGAGVTTNSCIRPFLEYRYNLKWREASLRIGLLYTINCKKRGMVPCPKIPDPPQF